MNVLIVLAHPERKSFNGGLVDEAVEQLVGEGHTVEVDDLYAEQFDPVERPEQYPHSTVASDYFYPSMSSGLTTRKTHYRRISSGSWRGWSGLTW